MMRREQDFIGAARAATRQAMAGARVAGRTAVGRATTSLAAALVLTATVLAQPAATQPAATQPADEAAAPRAGEARMPAMRVDRKAGVVELEAEVVLREGEWLELLATSPGTREHESILTVAAKPSHIHLGLVMIGLEPGKPLHWKEKGDEVEVIPPTGPEVRVTAILGEGENRREVDPGQWIMNRETKKSLGPVTWRFAGSLFREEQGRPVYAADQSGVILSLVSFGDDVLALPNKMDNYGDNAIWVANTDRIPPLGEKLTLRLTPVKAEPADDAGD